MSLSFDPSGDFANVVDGLEPVTLLRPGSSSTASVDGAMRAAVCTAEARASDGKVTAGDVVWHLPAAELDAPPGPGDVIVDAAGGRWTVLAVRLATAGSRWRCACRNLAVAGGLDQYVDIEQATYAKGEHGAEQTAWRPWRTGVAARIQPVRAVARDEHQRQVTTAEFVVYLAGPLAIDHTHRIKSPDGTIYRIIATRRAGQIAALTEIDVVRVA
jgi:hypothetical protein